jgi:hypothetical protein
MKRATATYPFIAALVVACSPAVLSAQTRESSASPEAYHSAAIDANGDLTIVTTTSERVIVRKEGCGQNPNPKPVKVPEWVAKLKGGGPRSQIQDKPDFSGRWKLSGPLVAGAGHEGPKTTTKPATYVRN